MADLTYTNFYKLLLSGTVDLVNDPVYAMLVSGSYVPSTGHKLHAEVSVHQVTDPLGSYAKGGKLLAGKYAALTTDGFAIFDANDATWTNSTITASGVVIWTSGASAAAHHLVCFVDLGGNQTSTNATFSVIWNNTYGVYRIGNS